MIFFVSRDINTSETIEVECPTHVFVSPDLENIIQLIENISLTMFS